MRKSVLLAGLIFMFFVALSFYIGLWQGRQFLNRTRASQSDYSEKNTYTYLTPITARAGGQESIRVTIFVLNDDGLGVAAKKLQLDFNSSNLIIKEQQGVTDQYGRAVFDVSSKETGEYFGEVMIDGKSLSQKVRLKFN